MGGTDGWARTAVQLNLRDTGLAAEEDVDLDAYLVAVAALPALRTVREERFAQMVESLSGRARPAAEA